MIFGGLSFVKTVISTIVAGSLSADESGSGMGFLNFSCFLAEGIGIAVVGGLLTQLRFNFSIFPIVTDVAAYLYSNLTLLLLAVVITGGAIFMIVFKGEKASLDH